MSEPTPLLPLLAAGDRAAASACIERYSGLVWSLARRYLSNDADAEEAVQDIFMHLWRQAGTFDRKRAAEVTFVSLLARRRLIDRFRRQGRRPQLEPLAAAESVLCDKGLRVLEQSLELQRVEEALQGIEPRQREVIHLSAWLGLTHQDIAERLDMPLGTVKSHLRRGLIRVREALGEEGAAKNGAIP
jgi:RNA polymerase sigma-70 factor (ECF subfamily)